jgi:lambda repressor-like predicted transcriptional regulator
LAATRLNPSGNGFLIKPNMTKKGTNRAASTASRKNTLVTIDINPDRAWYTKCLMRGFYQTSPVIQSVIRASAKKDGISLAEFSRRASDSLAKCIAREKGKLRETQKEAKRLGISIGHLIFCARFPNRSLN